MRVSCLAINYIMSAIMSSFMLKLLQYCNYIIIVRQIQIMLLLSVLLAGMHFG